MPRDLVGRSFGHYRVTATLGAGGMGEVYRATDTRLGREVAIKILPEGFASDPERLARFEREAKLLAQLHHANVASVFGLEDGDGVGALVMELVEGEDLSQRLAQGPVAAEDAVAIARQIAGAIEAAHESGIVHRDLKPANVKIAANGDVKVLDFGLAKAFAGETTPGSEPSLSQSPTVTRADTAAGVILGTAAYMAPEQARGRAVDKRADVWAFGVVLFEMLSGGKLFDGETVTDVLAAVVRQEIDWSRLPAATPSRVLALLRRCLDRDPRTRLRDIGEARIALSGPLETATERRPGEARPWARILPWGVAAVAVIALVAILGHDAGSGPVVVAAPTALGVELPHGFALAGSEAPIVDVSRDGRTVVFEADGPDGRRLFRRRLDRVGVEPIPGTEGALHPFLSPDGRWVGFYADSRIRKVPIEGGTPVDLANVSAYRGATWAEGGTIVYTDTYASGLVKVRESGGTREPLTRLDAERHERTHRWPGAVAGTPWVLFTVGVSKSPNYYDDSRIDAVRVDTGERKTVFEGAWMARFAPPRTLLVQRRGSLLALDFDPVSATARGPEHLVIDGIGGEPSSGAGYFSAGAGATLAYVPSEAISNEKSIALATPGGDETTLPLPPKNYWFPRASPDGRSIAVDVGSGQGTDDDVWIYDLARRTFSRFTFDPPSMGPVWSPDGRWIAYGGTRNGRTATIVKKRADGAGPEEAVWTGHDITLPCGWSPDGATLAVLDSTNDLDVVLVSVDDGTSRQLGAAPGMQWGASFSPDGRFVAYTTTETGVDEVFVRSLPEGNGKWQVSVDGGQHPVWSGDGRRLFFVKDDAIWSVDVDTAGAFRFEEPRQVLKGPYILRTAPFRNFDVTPDGRFVVVRRRTDVEAPRKLEIVVGWPSVLDSRRGR